MDDELTFQWYDIENDPWGWDRHVTRVGANPFHRNAMLELHQPGKAFRRGVLIARGEDPVGLVGGLLHPAHGGGWFHSLSFPRLCAGLDPRLPRALGEWLLRQGVTRIHLGSMGGGVEGYAATGVGRVAARVEFLYDLRRSEGERLRRISAGHRRQLQESEASPVRLRRIESGRALLMTVLKCLSARRRGQPFGVRRMVESYRFYRRLTERLVRQKWASLYGLHDGRGRVLSLAYVLERAGTGFYMSGVESGEGRRRGAGVRLLWEMARWLPRAGVHTLNLGGVSVEAREEGHEEHDEYRFRAGFGGEPTLRHSLTIG